MDKFIVFLTIFVLVAIVVDVYNAVNCEVWGTKYEYHAKVGYGYYPVCLKERGE